MTRRTQDAYDAWAKSYDHDPNPHLALEHEEVLKLVAPMPRESVLDAACGTGRYTGEIAAVGAKVIGIDFSDQMLAIARKKHPAIEFQRADLSQPLPFPEDVFDCIVCAQTLKHLPVLKPTFAEFARTLRSGGRLVFSVTHPDMSWDGYQMRERPAFLLPEHADIFHHRFSDYLAAIESAPFALDQIKQLAVNEKVRTLLTEESFEIVKGRFQIVVFRLKKP